MFYAAADNTQSRGASQPVLVTGLINKYTLKVISISRGVNLTARLTRYGYRERQANLQRFALTRG